MSDEASSDAVHVRQATRPNLAAVAALAGVSASTASIAFSGSGPISATTKERVLAAAVTLDYAGPDPRAQSLRRGRSGIVGVVIEDRLSDAFRDPMNIAMLDGLADETGAIGSGLLLLTDTGDGQISIENAPVDAVVLVGCSTRLDAAVAILRRRGIPLVAIEAAALDGVLAIDLDNREASHALAEHVRGLGHLSVAIVTLPLDPSRERGPLTAALEAASTGYTASARITGVREVFPHASGWIAAGSLVEEGRIAGLQLLGGSEGIRGGEGSRGRDPRPTAIIAQSDLLARGVILAAEELGLRVPEDVSIVGFDGVRLEGMGARDLTTMVQPAIEKGRAAGRGVVALLADEPGMPERFTCVFHRGNTTGPPPIPLSS
ncbi:MAG: LacI family DNA-binding transcriptional regulator [Lacisediminihabitans sp.]